jgi:hypothetical protein
MHPGMLSVNLPLIARFMAAILHAFSVVPTPDGRLSILASVATIASCCSFVIVLIAHSLVVSLDYNYACTYVKGVRRTETGWHTFNRPATPLHECATSAGIFYNVAPQHIFAIYPG